MNARIYSRTRFAALALVLSAGLVAAPSGCDGQEGGTPLDDSNMGTVNLALGSEVFSDTILISFTATGQDEIGDIEPVVVFDDAIPGDLSVTRTVFVPGNYFYDVTATAVDDEGQVIGTAQDLGVFVIGGETTDLDLTVTLTVNDVTFSGVNATFAANNPPQFESLEASTVDGLTTFSTRMSDFNDDSVEVVLGYFTQEGDAITKPLEPDENGNFTVTIPAAELSSTVVLAAVDSQGGENIMTMGLNPDGTIASTQSGPAPPGTEVDESGEPVAAGAVVVALAALGVIGYIACIAIGPSECLSYAQTVCAPNGVSASAVICGFGYDVDGQFQLGFKCSFKCNEST